MTWVEQIALEAEDWLQAEVHPIIQRHLATDPDITSRVNQRVYAGDFPEDGVAMPAVKFRFPQAVPLTPPALDWWSHVGQVDVYADAEVLADEVVSRVIRSLMRLQQTSHPEGVIGTLSGWGIESARDSSWTPPKPRRIVSVTLTARRNE